MASFNPAGAAAANQNPNKSLEVTPAPEDSVSSLSFSPKANHLVATSWDKQVRCWEVLPGGACQAKASISHDEPVLCSAWKDDGMTVFSGGCDKQIKMWPLLSGGQPTTFSGHEAPVKELAWVPQMNLLVSGSWDKTLRYWDIRQPQPVHVQQLPERCYALSLCYPLMVVGTADRNIVVFNLQNPQERAVIINYFVQSKYNCPGMHSFQVHGTFATTGSDGGFNFWDKDSKQRLKAFSKCPAPITCSTFNQDGSIFAYAVCYDWSKGAEKHNPSTAKTNIFIHSVQVCTFESDVKGKPRTGKK
nr:unnamed protein product [Digitaria exilis]